VGPFARGRVGGPDRLGCKSKGAGACLLSEAPEVVEAHRGGSRDALFHVGLAQIAKHPVAEAPGGHRSQLLLYPLQHGAGVCARHLQGDREQRREPAHRAGEIDVVEQLLASVALEIDEHLSLTRPLRQRLGQRGEQDVVHLRAVDGRDLTQQRLGLGFVERDRHRGSAGCVVAAVVVI
jgi:hypothetical protein